MSKKSAGFLMSRKLYQVKLGAIIHDLKDGDSEAPNWSRMSVIAVDADQAIEKANKNLKHNKELDEYIESVVLEYDLEDVVE